MKEITSMLTIIAAFSLLPLTGLVLLKQIDYAHAKDVTLHNGKDNLINNVEIQSSQAEGIKELGHPVKGLSLAIINPIFTEAMYNKSFYDFIHSHEDAKKGQKITSNLSLLSSKISNELNKTRMISFLAEHLKVSSPGSNITLMTDLDVHNGSIFNRSGLNKYDVLVLGHEEYVTQEEYANFKKFVANGGTMILLSSNAFMAEVRYDRNTEMVTLVKGHWWAFNGKFAWISVGERWKKENSDWMGSNYFCYLCKYRFDNNPFDYSPHEEDYITNPNAKILINYNASDLDHKGSRALADDVKKKFQSSTDVKYTIATYLLKYKKGEVIALGIYSDDLIGNDKFMHFLDSLIFEYARS